MAGRIAVVRNLALLLAFAVVVCEFPGTAGSQEPRQGWIAKANKVESLQAAEQARSRKINSPTSTGESRKQGIVDQPGCCGIEPQRSFN